MSKLINRKTSEVANEVKTAIAKDVEDVKEEHLSNKTEDLMPTGNTLLNCACSDNPFGGYALGTVVMAVGDSSTGKSFLLLTALAEVCTLPRFDEYNLYYDDSEFAFSFNAEKLFGEKFVDRVDMDMGSNKVSDFYGNIMNCLDRKKPFIYILDTYDALTDEAEEERAEIARKKVSGEKLTKKEEQSKGGYKTEKVRKFAEVFRRCRAELKLTNSVFIVIFQTIDAINAQFATKTRRGGNAPKFFSSHEVWLKQAGKPYESKGLEIGIDTGVKVKKNKITGKVREVSFPIFYDYGVDDTRSSIEFLIEQDVFKKDKNSIVAPALGIEKASLPKLIEHIEKKQLQDKLRSLVGNAWLKREADVRLNRKPKF